MYVRTWINQPRDQQSPRVNGICIDEPHVYENNLEDEVFITFEGKTLPGILPSYRGTISEMHMTFEEAEEFSKKLQAALKKLNNKPVKKKEGIVYTIG